MSDARLVYVAQGARAVGYGCTAVLLGVMLDARGWTGWRAGLVLTATVGGGGLMSLVVGRYADLLGRRRTYVALHVLIALAGVVVATSHAYWPVVVVALTGALSTDVVDSGPLTTIEVAVLGAVEERRARRFGTYNAVAAIGGSFGALIAGGPSAARHAWPGLPAEQRFFLILVPVAVVGGIAAYRLSSAAESAERRRVRLVESRSPVRRLAALFAVDSAAGGLAVQSLVAYYLRTRFDASLPTLAGVFFAAGLLQTASYLLGPRIAERIGLVETMVVTHLPSNVLLVLLAVAPTLPLAVAAYLGRQLLSQMDVPTRQAFLAELAPPEELTAAAAYTNTARTLARPVGTLSVGPLQQIALGTPFAVAGVVKSLYDLALWRGFRNAERPGTQVPGRSVEV